MAGFASEAAAAEPGPLIGSFLQRLAEGNTDVLRAALRAQPMACPARSEYDPGPGPRPPARALVEAAVLLPIVLRRAPTVMFTRRTGNLSRHAGQISFPGGRVERGDASPVDAALRETREETGLSPERVAIAGFLDGYETGSFYAIQPVVGIVEEGFDLAPDPHEVAEIFEVPLAFLLDPANRETQTMERMGAARRFYVFRHGDHRIWGATAAILVDLQVRLGRVLGVADGKARHAPVDNPHADRS